MDIFAYALQMELDGKAYYAELAKHAGYKDLEVVFVDLAEAEKRHYEIIKEARDAGHYAVTPGPMPTLPNVFAFPDELKEKSPEWLAQWKKEQLDVYQAALLKEQQSVALYQDLKTKVVTLTSESRQDYPPIIIHPDDFGSYSIAGVVSQVIKV